MHHWSRYIHRDRRAFALTGLLFVLIGAVVLWGAQDFQLFQVSMILAYAVSLLGLNILTGFNGQISLGHGAFFAIGAYITAIAIDRYEIPYVFCIPLAAVLTGVVGYLFGRPALKLDGIYLALATFALGMVIPQLLKHKAFEEYTGGVQGISLDKISSPFDLPITQDHWIYVFSFIVVAIVFVLAYRLLSSSSGRAMRAIRDNPLAAEALGINNKHYKSMSFALSAALTGIGGALSALTVQFVSPDGFNVFLSISFLVGIVVGGVGTIYGALFGAVFIMFVPSLSEEISQAAPWAIYGVVLITLVFILPKGVVGLFKSGRERFSSSNFDNDPSLRQR